MSQALRDQECKVVGIEINAEAADRAAAICEKVIVADLDYVDFDQELGSDRFDVVVAADVLEHLKDPVSVLSALRKFLVPGGYVVISVPNIAHLSVRLALLAGKFPYAEGGLLDRTHLRFFTRESAEKLLEEAGLFIGHFQTVEIVPLDPAQFEVPYDPHTVPPDVFESLSLECDAWAYQFVMAACPLSQPIWALLHERMKQLANEGEHSRQDFSKLTQALAQLRKDYESLAGRAAAIESEGMELESSLNTLLQENTSLRGDVARLQQTVEQMRAREKDLREMLLEAHDQLLRRDEEIAAALPAFLSHAPAAAGQVTGAPLAGRYLQYQQVVKRVREVMRDAGPRNSNVLVISKGDDELLALDGCQGSHFPQNTDGEYAGYYPEDGTAAIKHLEELRERGAQFLLIPQTALWWLDHYPEFSEFLTQHFSCVITQPDVCLLFDLTGQKQR